MGRQEEHPWVGAFGNCLYDADYRSHLESVRKLETPVSAAQKWPQDSLINKVPRSVSGSSDGRSLGGGQKSVELTSQRMPEDGVSYGDEDDDIFEDDEGFEC